MPVPVPMPVPFPIPFPLAVCDLFGLGRRWRRHLYVTPALRHGAGAGAGASCSALLLLFLAAGTAAPSIRYDTAAPATSLSPNLLLLVLPKESKSRLSLVADKQGTLPTVDTYLIIKYDAK